MGFATEKSNYLCEERRRFHGGPLASFLWTERLALQVELRRLREDLTESEESLKIEQETSLTVINIIFLTVSQLSLSKRSYQFIHVFWKTNVSLENPQNLS